MKKPKFVPGNRTIQLKHEERVFLLNWSKTLKPKTDLERRIVKRFLHRMMGTSLYLPLYPPKECPHCEREVAGQVFDTHVVRCLQRVKVEMSEPKIDPVVLEMMNYGL